MGTSGPRRLGPVAAVGALAGLTVVALVPGGLVDRLERAAAPAAAASGTAAPSPTQAATGGAPTSADAPAAPVPDPRTLADALAGPLGAAVLGDDVGVVVRDLATGAVLLDRDAATPRVPASTAKLVTAVSALHHLGPDAVLTTRTVRDPATGAVVLVGGGDVTLSRRERPGWPRSASVARLARDTAAALRADGVAEVPLVLDDTLFTGPRTAPGWEPGDLAAGTVAPVSALAVDAGRRRPGERSRVADLTADAGARFAAALRRHGVRVTATRRGRAPAGAEPLAQVGSPRVAALVERMLLTSDNDLAEALGRAAAAASGAGGSFRGAAAAAAEALRAYGLDPDGARLVDASGLSRRDAVTPTLLADLLVAAARPENPELAPVLTGLPAAGVEGTLADRFDGRGARAGRGVVRAKTGTLTGTHALAGTVLDRDGRTLVFAVLADGTSPLSLEVRAALDRVATTLARCGCR